MGQPGSATWHALEGGSQILVGSELSEVLLIDLTPFIFSFTFLF